MWLNGAHPTTINAEATIPLCLRVSATQCCQNVGTINVKKCAADTSGVGDFFVYNLPAAPGCHMAYCYGKLTKKSFILAYQIRAGFITP